MAEAAGRGGTLAGIVLASLLATAVLTAAYATRALLVTVTRDEEDRGQHPVLPRAVMPRAVAAVLVLLALVSLLGGLALGRLPEAGEVPLSLFAVVLVLVLAGIGIGWLLHTSRWQAWLVGGRAGRLVGAGLGVGTLHRVLVVRPVGGLARMVAFLDTGVIDSYVRALSLIHI